MPIDDNNVDFLNRFPRMAEQINQRFSISSKTIGAIRVYPVATTDAKKLVDGKVGFRRMIKAILERNQSDLYYSAEQVHDFEMELAVRILAQAWRADELDNLIGRKNGMMWPLLHGVEGGRVRFNNTPYYETRSYILVALAVRNDDPRVIDLMDKWIPGKVDVPIDVFMKEDAPNCMFHALKRLQTIQNRVEDVHTFMEMRKQQPPPPTKPMQQQQPPPTSKWLSPLQPDGGDSEHMRAYRAREAVESAARAEAERDARAKIDADRKQRRVTASKPTRLDKGVNPPPQKTKNLVDGPLDAHDRAKQVTKKAAAVEEAFAHTSRLKAAEDARVAAAEAKLSLIRIGREIGGHPSA